MNLAAAIIAGILKVVAIYYLTKLGLYFFNPEKPLYAQNPLVWTIIYLPLFNYYEGLIIGIVSKIRKTK